MKKKFQGYLILNWKTQEMRVLKRYDKTKIAPHEVPLKIDIDLELPDKKIHEVKGKITIPAEKVAEMVVESL